MGVDPISSARKICSFDCVYCQVRRAKPYTGSRKIFVPTDEIISEIRSLPAVKLDYITFSGAGEPTLAKNLGQIIRAIRKIRGERIAVLTNSSLIYRKDVQKDLQLADFVAAKLDASSTSLFKKINRPKPGLRFDRVVKGIKEFKAKYKGRLALQIMFMGENISCAGEIARLAEEIDPDEVQINTPLRPCGIKSLSRKDMDKIKGYFRNMDVSSVYDAKRKKVKPINMEGMTKRRSEI